MRLTSLFSVLAVVVAVKATTNTSETSAVDTIVKALKQGDIVGAAIDLFTLGSCDIANDAGCLSAFASVAAGCAGAAVSQGKNPSDNLNCLSKALDAIGSSGFAKCADCLEEGLSIAQSVIQ